MDTVTGLVAGTAFLEFLFILFLVQRVRTRRIFLRPGRRYLLVLETLGNVNRMRLVELDKTPTIFGVRTRDGYFVKVYKGGILGKQYDVEDLSEDYYIPYYSDLFGEIWVVWVKRSMFRDKERKLLVLDPYPAVLLLLFKEYGSKQLADSVISSAWNSMVEMREKFFSTYQGILGELKRRVKMIDEFIAEHFKYEMEEATSQIEEKTAEIISKRSAKELLKMEEYEVADRLRERQKQKLLRRAEIMGLSKEEMDQLREMEPEQIKEYLKRRSGFTEEG